MALMLLKVFASCFVSQNKPETYLEHARTIENDSCGKAKKLFFFLPKNKFPPPRWLACFSAFSFKVSPKGLIQIVLKKFLRVKQ